jgi:hypothetical protein
MKQLSFTSEDVADFLDNHGIECVEPCNLADDHPFQNGWHNGSWEDTLTDRFTEIRAEQYPNVIDADVADVLAEVGELAFSRGYDNGVGVELPDLDD